MNTSTNGASEAPDDVQVDIRDAAVPRAPLRRQGGLGSPFSVAPRMITIGIGCIAVFFITYAAAPQVFPWNWFPKPSASVSSLQTPNPNATAPPANIGPLIPVGDQASTRAPGGPAVAGNPPTAKATPASGPASTQLDKDLNNAAGGLHQSAPALPSVPPVVVGPLRGGGSTTDVPNPQGPVIGPSMNQAPIAVTPDGQVIVVSGGVAPRSPSQQTAPEIIGQQPGGISGSTTGQIVADQRKAFQTQDRTSPYLTSIQRDALNQTEVFAGTPILCELDDKVVSTLPGSIYAHVTQWVRSSLPPHDNIIPPGTTIVGRYNSATANNDNRLQTGWDTMTMPDGETLDLQGAAAQEPDGSQGLVADSVDRHTGKAVGQTLLASVAQAGIDRLSQPSGTSVVSIGANAAGQGALTAVNQQIVNAQVQQAPTLTINQHHYFIIRLPATIIMHAYHGGSTTP